MQRQGASCSYDAEAKKRRRASQSGARLPQGLLPLRSLRFGDAIGLSPFSPSRRKRGRGGQESSICEEFPSTNFSPSIPTWTNVERREKNPPRPQISTHISAIFVPRQDVFGEACMENRSSAPRLKNFLRRALDTPQTGVRSFTFGGPRRAVRRIIPIALHLRTLDFRHIPQ